MENNQDNFSEQQQPEERPRRQRVAHYSPRGEQGYNYNNRYNSNYRENREGGYQRNNYRSERPYQRNYSQYQSAERRGGEDYSTSAAQSSETFLPTAPGRLNDSYRSSYNQEGEYNQSYSRGGEYRPTNGYQRNNYGGRYNGTRRQGGYNQSRQGYGYQQGESQPYNNQGGYQNRPNNRFNNGRFNAPQQKKKAKKRNTFVAQPQFVDYSKPMRLNKFLANSGTCSRREADELIQAGVVYVNGVVVTELGTKIIPATDKVVYHDQPVRAERKVYILLNKPKNCITSVEDPHAKMTVLDLVKGACRQRIYPVGRLDRNTTGVLLLTNDGDLTTKLTHPKYNKKKIYQVTLDHDITDEQVAQLREGIELEDGPIKVDELSFPKEDNRRTLGIEIHSGRNRIVRRMFDALGFKVVKLDRVLFAGLTKKGLGRGKWRFLTETEVGLIKMSAASIHLDTDKED